MSTHLIDGTDEGVGGVGEGGHADGKLVAVDGIHPRALLQTSSGHVHLRALSFLQQR